MSKYFTVGGQITDYEAPILPEIKVFHSNGEQNRLADSCSFENLPTRTIFNQLILKSQFQFNSVVTVMYNCHLIMRLYTIHLHNQWNFPPHSKMSKKINAFLGLVELANQMAHTNSK